MTVFFQVERAADQETQELLRFIVSRAERGKRIISDLLDYVEVSENRSGQLGTVDASGPAEWAIADPRTGRA